MGELLILTDGQVINGGSAGLADGYLWLWFTGFSLQDAAAIAFNPSKTARIIYHYGDDMEEVYTGYTNCVSLGIDAGGEVSVCMVRE